MARLAAKSRSRARPAARAIARGDAAFVRPTADEARLEKLLLKDLAPRDLLLRAMHCAKVQGVAALDALTACTAADPDDVTSRLAARFGIGILQATDFPSATMSAEAARAAMQTGILRLPDGGFIVSMRGRAVIELARHLKSTPGDKRLFRLASPAMFTTAVLHAASTDLAESIAHGPARIDAAYSARSRLVVFACFMTMAIIAVTSIVATVAAPLPINIAFALLFVTLTVLRLLAALGDPAPRGFARVPDELLPVYTLLIPLFRERASVRSLVQSLMVLDYPEAKLDIKLLLETGDDETIEAARLYAPSHFEILTVPPGFPCTKPRALNAGLALARGSFVAVFDAEDRPHPGQLRVALNAFQRGGAKLACVQARLVIDNIADAWLTKIFAVEYAGLFDALLPALARSKLFFPLGGTSNHFRTAVLDRVGGWDAWNVTEDADLGLRLARFGYRAAVVRSSTLEEAPNTLGAWLRQRTRWLKGYMLTWAVHMRNPRRLYRELGFLNFLAFHAFIGGVPISALILPVFLCGVGLHIATGVWLTTAPNFSHALNFTLDGFNLVFGFGAAMALAAIGADRRELKGVVRWIPTVPIYWLLSSIAAWRAMWQLFRTPYLWEKTEHGLARTSHSGAEIVSS